LDLNDILNSSGYTQVDVDDDSDKINVEDCDTDEEASINSDDHESQVPTKNMYLRHKHRLTMWGSCVRCRNGRGVPSQRVLFTRNYEAQWKDNLSM
jgi:uncharacterized metal-binding protein YceD (DUF177 family)